MLQLNSHPIFAGINPLKKKGLLFRFFLARQYAKLFPPSLFVGISGSVGKTTTALACKAVLSEKMQTISTTDTHPGIPNLDPIFNLPLTILRVRPQTKKVILELGIEYRGEMDLYLSLVKPQTVIVTRVSFAHSEFLGDIEEIVEEKGKLVTQLGEGGVAILNWDDPNVRKLSQECKGEVIYFGTDQKNCHVWAGQIRIENFQTVFQLNYGVERVEVRSNLLGAHQVYSLLAAASLGINLGIPLTMIKKGLEKVEGLDGRMKAVPGISGSIIIDDTYNSSPSAVEEAIETLNQLPARRRIVVLGEMKELGEYSEKLHRQIARKIYKDKIDLCLTGGGNAKSIGQELSELGFIPQRLHSGLQNSQIVSILLKILGRGDVVLIKASKDLRFKEIVQRLSKKGQ